MSKDDILDLYGQCSRGKCICLITGWLGRKCSSWNSFGAETFDELKVAQKEFSIKANK
mgnify:CR=1 FL=1